MRAVVQRVKEASVSVAGERVSAQGPGLLVLLGVGKGDGEAEVAWMAEKLATLRIFEDAAGKMNLSVEDTHRALIVVSQFTLYGDTRRGRRPAAQRIQAGGRAGAGLSSSRVTGPSLTSATCMSAANTPVPTLRPRARSPEHTRS